MLNTSNVVLERSISLPGGVNVTKRAGGDVWSYPNIHGDVQATANAAGVKQGATLTYDPYGQPLTAIVDNSAGNIDNAWLGVHNKQYEHETGLKPLIEMGARPYDPALGRFISVDPIAGGCSNDYVYVKDPRNDFDLAGTACGRHSTTVLRFFGYGDYFRALNLARQGRLRQAAEMAGIAYVAGYTRAQVMRLIEAQARGVVKRFAKKYVELAWPIGIFATLLDALCRLIPSSGPRSSPPVDPHMTENGPQYVSNNGGIFFYDPATPGGP